MNAAREFVAHATLDAAMIDLAGQLRLRFGTSESVLDSLIYGTRIVRHEGRNTCGNAVFAHPRGFTDTDDLCLAYWGPLPERFDA